MSITWPEAVRQTLLALARQKSWWDSVDGLAGIALRQGGRTRIGQAG